MYTSTLVIGAGNWGTAFACLLDSESSRVSLYTRNEKVREQILKHRENREYLPGISISPGIKVVKNLSKAVKDAQLIILAIPSHTLRDFLRENEASFPSMSVFLNLSKGLEYPTGMRMSEVFAQEIGSLDRWATLSGPNLAVEIARTQPAIAVIASNSHSLSENLQNFVSSKAFRAYTNPDLCGVEVCGALKNVIAIGSGICHGLQLGNNAVAALITRGIAEISRFGLAMGADPMTFLGLAGVGDLTVTCMSTASRNHTLGRLIASGATLEQATKQTRMVAEGVNTCRTISKISAEQGIYMPIVQGVSRILFEGTPPLDVIKDLMMSSLKSEQVDR